MKRRRTTRDSFNPNALVKAVREAFLGQLLRRNDINISDSCTLHGRKKWHQYSGFLYTVRPRKTNVTHARGLRRIRDRIDQAGPGTFRNGIVLYAGAEAFALGDRLTALPLSALWTAPA